MKINQKLQSQILPLLNSQVSDTISTQREAFTDNLQGSLEVLENIEENLADLAPVEVEIALDKMCDQLKEVIENFQDEISSICGKDGALVLIRKIRGESAAEAAMRKDHRAAKAAARKTEYLERKAAHQQLLAERAEAKAAAEAAQDTAAKPKKAVKKITRRSK